MEFFLPPIAASFEHPVSGSRCISRESAPLRTTARPTLLSCFPTYLSKDLFFIHGRFENQPKFEDKGVFTTEISLQKSH